MLAKEGKPLKNVNYFIVLPSFFQNISFSSKQNEAVGGRNSLQVVCTHNLLLEIIMRQHQRNVRSSAPLLPSHQ